MHPAAKLIVMAAKSQDTKGRAGVSWIWGSTTSAEKQNHPIIPKLWSRSGLSMFIMDIIMDISMDISMDMLYTPTWGDLW